MAQPPGLAKQSLMESTDEDTLQERRNRVCAYTGRVKLTGAIRTIWHGYRDMVVGAVLVLASVAAAAVGFGLATRPRPGVTLQGTASKKANEADAVSAAPGVSLRIQPLVRPLFAKDSPEAVCINRLLQEPPQGPLNVSYCCHLLRLYGLGAFRHSRFSSGQDVVAALTDQKLSESLFAEPIFFQTRSGIRYRDPTIQKVVNGENHRDICLAAFARAYAQ